MINSAIITGAVHTHTHTHTHSINLIEEKRVDIIYSKCDEEKISV